MNQRDAKFPIPDVEAKPDTRRLAIDRVGIKSIRHPARIKERAGGIQHTVAHFNMYVGLPHQFKGTHMSRFVEILEAHEREISPDTFRVMLREMVKKLEAETGHIEMTFPYFVEDLVRDVAAKLNADPRVTGYVVESENFESIHNHSAYAMIAKGMDVGKV